MKMKILLTLTHVPTVMMVMMSAVVGTVTTATVKSPAKIALPRTTVYPGHNLKGKMFTLSRYNGGVSLYSPSFNPSPSPSSYPWTSSPPYSSSTTWRPTTTTPYRTSTTWRPTTTTPYRTSTTWRPTTTTPHRTSTTWRPTTTTPYRTSTTWTPTTTTPHRTSTTWKPTTTTPYRTSSWTTAPPSRGVSVCLRYVAEATDYQQIFTLSPDSSSRMTLSGSPIGGCDLSFSSGYYSLSFRSYRTFWSNVRPDFWTRVCVTVDTMKGVAQVFSGGNISVRKKLPVQSVLTGEPVIDIPGFDGQLTDVQVWDYPLRYREIINYMNGYYGSYRGSVLSWSRISYSLRGNSLLEDIFEWQENQPIRRGDREHGPMGEKRKKKFFNKGERKERKREPL
ncbi:mucin-3A-like [Centroberyx affinis]|uniref:mucin-3A-like n=1 Tax=Centroberyx affinis TaxID=166261 RepID=UPI003A5C5FF6